MKLLYSRKFISSYSRAPLSVRKAFDKKIEFLLLDLGHPSLRAKKYIEKNNIWQARVSRSWRFYFTIVNSTYQILDMTIHPK